MLGKDCFAAAVVDCCAFFKACFSFIVNFAPCEGGLDPVTKLIV
jgi:hypothetical protein